MWDLFAVSKIDMAMTTWTARLENAQATKKDTPTGLWARLVRVEKFTATDAWAERPGDSREFEKQPSITTMGRLGLLLKDNRL
jgi:hypothetical protein